MSVQGEPLQGVADILAGGPVGTTFQTRLRWPDGSETDHDVLRPDKPNLPPPSVPLGEGWLVSGRVGEVGYLHIRTFDPEKAILGPDGKITTMLRAALAELADTEALILDLQGNGGGVVAASDPFLGNLIKRSLSYRWGNAGGKRRVIRPRTPHYSAPIVALVDGRSASGGEWAARILRDAKRAVVIGERTAGAEAAVHTSKGPDGSVVRFSAWPMVEPGRPPFPEVGIELDHDIPLTIEGRAQAGPRGRHRTGPTLAIRTGLARLGRFARKCGAADGACRLFRQRRVTSRMKDSLGRQLPQTVRACSGVRA